jgi:hypothetical protein
MGKCLVGKHESPSRRCAKGKCTFTAIELLCILKLDPAGFIEKPGGGPLVQESLLLSNSASLLSIQLQLWYGGSY